MGTKLSPIGFWSYARQDDERQLNRLRLQLSFQVQQRYGREHVKIFQDVSAIPPGADWEAKIRSALDDSAFFIPIITPNFLESKWCDEEFFIFLEKEKRLSEEFPLPVGQRRIFPIHYVDVEDVEGYSPKLVPELKKAQWLDFRDLIYKDPEDEEVRKRLGELATSICQLLRRDRKMLADREAGIVTPPAPRTIDDVGTGHAGLGRESPAATSGPGLAPVSPPMPAPSPGGRRKQLIAGSALALVVAAGVAFAVLHAKPKPLPPGPPASDTAAAAPSSAPAPGMAAASSTSRAQPADSPPPSPVQTARLAPQQVLSPPPAAAGKLASGPDTSLAPPAKLPACVQSVVDKARVIEKGAKATIAEALSTAQSAEAHANAEKAAHKDSPSAPLGDPWKTATGVTFVYWGDTQADQPLGLGVMEFSDGGREAGRFDGSRDGYGVLTEPKQPGAVRPQRVLSRVKSATHLGFVAVEESDGTTRMDESDSGKWLGFGAVIFRDGSEFLGQLPDGGAKVVGALYSKGGDLTNAGYFVGNTFSGPYDGATCPA